MNFQSTNPAADAALAGFVQDGAIINAAQAVINARRRALAEEAPRTVIAETLAVLAAAGDDAPTAEQVAATISGLAAAAVAQGEQAAAAKVAVAQALGRHGTMMEPLRSAIAATVAELNVRREAAVRERDGLHFRPPEGSVRDQLLRLPGFDPSHLQRLALPAEVPDEEANARWVELNEFTRMAWDQLGALQKINIRRLDLDAVEAIAGEHPRIAEALVCVREALGTQAELEAA